MNTDLSFRVQHIRSERGVALVITLSVLAVLLLLLVGFTVSMRTEQAAARNFNYMLLARQLAEGAVQEAVFQIRANTPILSTTDFYVTHPNRIVGRDALGPFSEVLYSTNDMANAGSVNINADNSIIAPHAEYSTMNASDTEKRRDIWSGWVRVREDGTPGIPPPSLIGRYTFWVDEEASKLNINTAAIRSTTNGVSGRDIDLTILATSASGYLSDGNATNSWNYARTNGFYTTEQWKLSSGIGSATYMTNKFYVTAFSQDSDLTPWGRRRFNLNTNYNDFVAEIRGAGTNTLNHPGVASFFGASHAFTNKYADLSGGTNLIKQLMANILDFRLKASGNNLWCTGADDLDTGGSGTVGIPNNFLGLRRYPYLNEIGVVPTWEWTSGPGTAIRARLWVFAELINPYNLAWGSSGSVKFTIDKFYVRVNAFDPLGNSLPNFPYEYGVEGGWQKSIEVAISDVPAHSYSLIITNFTFDGSDESHAETETNAVIDLAEVRIDKIRLLQTGFLTDTTADPNRSIRDWASWLDFSAYAQDGILGTSPNPSNHFTFVGTNKVAQTSSQPSSLSTLIQGLAKNDPRVRRFVQWEAPLPAWYRVGDISQTDTVLISTNMTLGTKNTGSPGVVNYQSGTGLTGVPNDPDPSPLPSDPANHPSFYMKNAGASDTPYESLGELGYVHTGLQWRTIMLQPQPATEATANLIPDWVMLDTFTVTNEPGRININAAVSNLTEVAFGKRITPLAAVLPNAAQMTTWGFGDSADEWVIATNIYNMTWTPSSTWGTSRTTAPFSFLPAVYNMVGELCEVDKLADNFAGATNDAMREARIRSIANLVTTRSNTFTIWAVGQAVAPNSDPTNPQVVAEAKVQAVVERYEEAGTVKFRTLYFRYLTD